MSGRELREFCKISTDGMQILKKAMNVMGLSARAYDRIIKVARTIADLDGVETIQPNHIAEAIQFRNLDRHNGLI
jgi:magnesium chelatase family protein